MNTLSALALRLADVSNKTNVNKYDYLFLKRCHFLSIFLYVKEKRLSVRSSARINSSSAVKTTNMNSEFYYRADIFA